MRVLVVNCGSSTLKFELLNMESSPEGRLARGIVDRIGEVSAIDFSNCQGENLQESRAVADHGEASRLILEWLAATGLMQESQPLAVGHRIIHGGDQFRDPELVDDEIITAIDALKELAPLHNEPALDALRAVRQILGPAVPMVAVFDTAFHHTAPKYASQYAIPHELAAKHRIRRYGFHGLAHRSMTERYAALTATPIEQVTLITLQLGNGCSVTAVRDGRSVDTSMGLTPLEGLIMGTRSGDVDPSLAGFLARREGVNVRVVEDWLNKKSGLLGISGYSSDMRELLRRADDGDEMSAMAVEMFCYRIRKYVGSYMAILGGVDAITFGGGIGENAPRIRARILDGMEWCGLVLDGERNRQAVGHEQRITTGSASIHAYVIPVNEAVLIARDTVACLCNAHKDTLPLSREDKGEEKWDD